MLIPISTEDLCDFIFHILGRIVFIKERHVKLVALFACQHGRRNGPFSVCLWYWYFYIAVRDLSLVEIPYYIRAGWPCLHSRVPGLTPIIILFCVTFLARAGTYIVCALEEFLAARD